MQQKILPFPFFSRLRLRLRCRLELDRSWALSSLVAFFLGSRWPSHPQIERRDAGHLIAFQFCDMQQKKKAAASPSPRSGSFMIAVRRNKHFHAPYSQVQYTTHNLKG